MTGTCSVPTPAERQYGIRHREIEEVLVRKVDAALQEAAERARSEMQAAGLDLPPPSQDYFTAMIHQRLYCMLCRADPQTFTGGRADVAVPIIRNMHNIARRYWNAQSEDPSGFGPG